MGEVGISTPKSGKAFWLRLEKDCWFGATRRLVVRFSAAPVIC